MIKLADINQAFWNDFYYKDGRNKTSKERKQFAKEKMEGLHPFVYDGKKWERISRKYSSNSGKTYDSTITYVAEDGEKVSIESHNKNNRKHRRIYETN